MTCIGLVVEHEHPFSVCQLRMLKPHRTVISLASAASCITLSRLYCGLPILLPSACCISGEPGGSRSCSRCSSSWRSSVETPWRTADGSPTSRGIKARTASVASVAFPTNTRTLDAVGYISRYLDLFQLIRRVASLMQIGSTQIYTGGHLPCR